MPRHEITYPAEMIKTESGSSLYNRWRKLRVEPHDPAWDDYREFYGWGMSNGYEVGSKLHRLDDAKPYSPDNCEWRLMDSRPFKGEEKQEFIDRWNNAVNRIRLHFGMKPLADLCEE